MRKLQPRISRCVVDDYLVEEARRLGGHTTKKEAATVALQEYVRLRKQLRIIDQFGAIDSERKQT